jgi:drug/metabolite transporter (DMT)-like permease
MLGAAMAPLPLEAHSLERLTASWQASPWPYPLGLGAAVCWGLYSTLSRRWAGRAEGGAVALFTFASGLVLGGIRLVRPETSSVSGGTLLLLGFMALFPVLIAYGLWDHAVRKGNLPLVAAASYGAPIVSTLLSSWLLDVEIGPNVWLACALVAGGALAAERAVLTEPTAHAERSEDGRLPSPRRIRRPRESK